MQRFITLLALISSLTACTVTNHVPGTTTTGRPQYIFNATVLAAHRLNTTNGIPMYRLETTVQQVMRGDSYVLPNQNVAVELLPNYPLPRQMQTCHFTALERHPAYAAGVLLLSGRILNCY